LHEAGKLWLAGTGEVLHNSVKTKIFAELLAELAVAAAVAKAMRRAEIRLTPVILVFILVY
jgi:hypothetical protein